MEELNKQENLREDLSDLSDNAPNPIPKKPTPPTEPTEPSEIEPDVEIELANQLDQDRLEFEWMLGCMQMDLQLLEDDIEADNEEQEVQEKMEEFKHETAAITPELIEQAKNARLEQEKKQKEKEIETDDTDPENDREDFEDDEIMKAEVVH